MSEARSSAAAGRNMLCTSGNCTLFSGVAASREQQQRTLGLGGVFAVSVVVESEVFAAARWQQLIFTGAAATAGG